MQRFTLGLILWRASDAGAIRTRHVESFKELDLFAKLLSRVDVGGLAIDGEVVSRNSPEGRGQLDVMGM